MRSILSGKACLHDRSQSGNAMLQVRKNTNRLKASTLPQTNY